MHIEHRTIGQLAKSLGVAASAIRYYEDSGLLPRPARSASGYRIYGSEDRRRLQLIVRVRTLGDADLISDAEVKDGLRELGFETA